MTSTASGSGPTEPPPPPHGGAGSTSGAPWHPAVEDISLYAEDLLSPGAADAVREHLDSCPECADTRDALQEIRTLLGSPGVPRMPSDVADRIDAALAAEALLSAAPGRRTGRMEADRGDEDELAALLEAVGHDLADTDAENLLSDSGRNPVLDSAPLPEAPNGRTREAEPAARPRVSVSATAPGPTGPGASGRAPERSPRGPGRGPGRRTRRRRTVGVLLSTAALAAAVALGGFVVQVMSGSDGHETTSSSAAAGAAGAGPSAFSRQRQGTAGSNAAAGVGEGTEYTEQNLAPRIMQLVREHSPQSNAATAPGGVSPQAAPVSPQPDSAHVSPGGAAAQPVLPRCVLAATGHDGDQPVATARGTFQGGPVGVVVYPAGHSGSELEVFLVDAGCELTTPSAPGAVRLHRVIPAP